VQTPTRSRSRCSSEQSGPVVFVLLWYLVLLSLCIPRPLVAVEQGKGGDLEVIRITPAGDEVPVGRQIVIEFNRAVVPLGRMERTAAEIPVTIEPQLNCRWRWLNPSTLACNLDEQDAFLPATSYSLVVLPGIEDGATLARPVHHRFTTELPRVTDTWFSFWLAPQLPVTMVRFNLPMAQASLSAHLYYLAPGGRRIPAVVEADPDEDAATGETSRQRLWRVHPQQELPADTPVELFVEPGIAALQGKERGLENRAIDTLTAIPAFRFLGIECTDRKNRSFSIEADAPLAGQSRCLPSGGISLLFSAPVLAGDIQAGLRFSPSLVRRHADANPWDEVYSYSLLTEPYTQGKRYSVFLPESLLRAFSEYRLQLAGDSLKDQFGRTLAGDVEMRFATDHRAPDFALLKNMPVLEKGLDTEAHVWAVNLDELDLSYETQTADGGRTKANRVIRPEGPRDASIPVPLGVREMIGGDSGLVQGHFSPRPEIPAKVPEESWFFAQVTPFQVHLKLGHHNSLVWITDMQTGNPVPGVTVEVLQNTFEGFSRQDKALAASVTGGDGVAEMAGTTEVDPTLEHVWADGREKPCLFLRCRKDGDMAVLPIRYEYQVASEGANREYIPDWLRPLYGHIRVWGATAQGIYKAGDTVQYKIYVRDQDNLRFTRPPGAGAREATAAGQTAAAGPSVSTSAAGSRSGTPPAPRYHLAVEDPMGKVIHEQGDIVLSPFGAMHGEVALPGNGAVGWYRFVLKSNFSKEEWQPIRVLVSDFTPSPFKVGTDLNGEHFQTGDKVEVTSEARLHAGGPYTEAATRVTATLEPQPLQPDRPGLSGFQFDIAETKDGRSPGIQTLYETEGNLDDQGRMSTSFTIAETPVWYGRLTVESSVRDDRGKSVANRTSAACSGRDRFVGVLQQDWTLRQEKAAKLRLVVIDREGAIVSGIPISVTSEYEKTWGARVKGAGDGYLTEYQHSWHLEQQLQGVSGSEPLELEFTPAHAGRLRLTAVIEDSRGRRHSTVIERWVTGAGVVLWESIPGNLLNVFAEKTGYTVGETARFFVQNPFPGAWALITVERFGVIQRWTRIFANSSEIIEIPVLPDYLPGFYLSVTVTSPRVEKSPGPQGEDLGKPTTRMGYVKVPVKDPCKELQVDIKPEKAVYKPGDEVRVDLQVRPKNLGTGEASPPVELAVAVLDEAVFDLLLQGSKAFDPYQGFYSLDELDLSNYNLLMQLVGREKLALKGASSGGDGGPDLSMRSLFKFVAYWNPSLFPDAEGRASIRFRVPDNLTGWRVLAMAVTPEDRMGLGEAVFKVNQSTEIRPVLPNQVLEGDQFAAGFTLMNRTDKARNLEVAIKATGPVRAAGAAAASDKAAVTMSEKLTAQPYQRLTLRFPLAATGSGEIQFEVTARDALDRDGLRQTLPVGERRSQEVAASHGMTSEAEAMEEVLFPQDMREDTGSLSLEMSPSVIGGIDGAFAFLRDYPYGCWEQKLGRAVMAVMYGPLKLYLRPAFSWPDSARAAGETLAMAVEHQAPNGGMVYYIPKDEYTSPYLSAFTLLSFNWLRQQGYRPPEHVERRLQDYLLNLLRHDAAPKSYSKGMTATVRAVALAALAESGKVKPADVERFRGHLPAMNLFGRSFYLKALLLTGAPRAQQQAVLDGILAHANEASGGMVFSESLDSGFQILHSSPVRDNAAIMINLLAWLAANPADSSVGEMPVRLMRSLSLSRKGRDHWPNTQENLFVAKALVDYARLYEDQAPRMTVEARLDEESLGGGRFAAFSEPPLLLERPLRAGDAGRKARLNLKKEGEGRLYYAARIAYSPAKPPDAAVNAGIEVHREYSVKRQGKWLLLREPMVLRTGEVVRVDLYVSLPAERYFVVLDDPVPGGLEPVNRHLATASQQDAAAGEAEDYPQGSYWGSFSGWQEDVASRWSFYHREFRHNAVRFYSERLAAGRYHLSYSAQAISPGEFQVLPVHAEEMYAPDVYGNGMAQRLKIEAAR
jgi:alpha-2-macroglobulin